MNRKLLTALIALLTLAIDARGQYENIWIFGNGVGLDFNNGSPTNISSSIDAWESCASICDANGQLLFYTDGYNLRQLLSRKVTRFDMQIFNR